MTKRKATYPLRFEQTDPCVGCATQCPARDTCVPYRQPLTSYSGIRFTSDGFDCALPISADSFNHCSFGCLYCFSDNLLSHREGTAKTPGVTSLRTFERIFAGEPGKMADEVRRALKYHAKRNGYPCPLQLGTLNDPCDFIERQQGWLLQFIPLAIRYRQPVRISTKGSVLLLKEYRDALAKGPELFWVTFSIITPDDELIEKLDERAPNATLRLKTMKALSKMGVRTSLRLRPMLPGVTDRTPRYSQAYRVLIERAAEAGATAISYEAAFYPGTPSKSIRARWDRLERITGVPLRRLYLSFGPNMACIRPAYTWTEDIMHAVRDVAHECGMTVGISDPVWKQLGDTGCCCGILPDDPVFGNWQTQSATNQLLVARDTGREIRFKDILPEWASDKLLGDMTNTGVGPLAKFRRDHATWADKLRENWNDLQSQRGPLNYFQGALMPVRRDHADDLVYKYVGLKRQHLPSVWQV